MTLNRDRRQVRANAHAIKRMDDASKPIFERVSRTALLPSGGCVDSGSAIYQVRSWARPYGTNDRRGVYNCVKMTPDNRTKNGVEGNQSPISGSSFGPRITDKAGDISVDFIPGSIGASNYEEYQDWDPSVNYSEGDIVQVTTQYTDGSTSMLRKVDSVYLALSDNVNSPPESNNEIWRELTEEVFNVCEQYNGIRRILDHPKLVRYDLIVANTYIDNTGEPRLYGSDTSNQGKIFYIDVDASSTPYIAVCNASYGAPDAAYGVPSLDELIQSKEGELGYNVMLKYPDWNAIDYSQITDPLRVIGMWFNGRWMLVPPNLTPAYLGGLEQNGQAIVVKVDETTIGFNATGEIETI